MSDAGRELVELKREIVEARNQAIKTDNQVKNLSLDVKGFEKRFDGLEGRVRLSSVGVNLIVAATIALAAYVVSAVRVKAYEGELLGLRAAVKEEHDTAAAKGEEMRGRLADLEKQRRAHELASDQADKIITLLDNKQDKDAGDLLDRLDLTQLTSLERRLGDKRFADLRRRQADTAYRSGRAAALASKYEAATPDLTRAMALDPESRNFGSARYFLAVSQFALKRYGDAEPLLREVAKADDKNAAEEGRYLLGATLAHVGKTADAKALLAPLGGGSGRFSTAAKAYLAAFDGTTDMPVDLPGGRVKVVRKAPPAATAVADDNNGN